MKRTESSEQQQEPRDWIVVHSEACRIALKEDDAWQKWYPQGKCIAKGLSKTEAQALAFFPERKFDMSKMSELVAEYNKLSGKSIKKFATVAKGEAAVSKLRAAAAPKTKKAPKSNGGGGRQPAFTMVKVFEVEGRRLQAESRRAAVYAEALRLGPKAALADIQKKFPDAIPYLRKLAFVGWVELS